MSARAIVRSLAACMWIGDPREIRLTLEHLPVMNWCRLSLRSFSVAEEPPEELADRLRPLAELALSSALITPRGSLLMSGDSSSRMAATVDSGWALLLDIRVAVPEFAELTSGIGRIEPPSHIEFFFNGLRVRALRGASDDAERYLATLELEPKIPDATTRELVRDFAREAFMEGRRQRPAEP